MRPRKNRLVLTLDTLRDHMSPGRSYTAAILACVFDGSPDAIVQMLETLCAAGGIVSAAPNCGRKRDLRKDRRRYWIAPPRRLTYADRTELLKYDLLRFSRLAMAARRLDSRCLDSSPSTGRE